MDQWDEGLPSDDEVPPENPEPYLFAGDEDEDEGVEDAVEVEVEVGRSSARHGEGEGGWGRLVNEMLAASSSEPSAAATPSELASLPPPLGIRQSFDLEHPKF